MQVSDSDKKAIRQTREWLLKIVIAHNFCPFALREFERDTIRYAVNDNLHIEVLLQWLADELQLLDKAPDIETSLLIMPQQFHLFDEYLEFVELAEQLLAELGYEGEYQLASFHPAYCFAGEDENDAANYTNRSPYPMLHIIRETSLEKALRNYPQPETIPQKNILLARDKGQNYFIKLLQACMKTPT